MNGYQCPARRDIQSSCELQEILATLVAAPYENRNGERQPYPLAALYARLALIQTSAPIVVTETFSSHLWGQMNYIFRVIPLASEPA